jgi:hypothetical protein
MAANPLDVLGTAAVTEERVAQLQLGQRVQRVQLVAERAEIGVQRVEIIPWNQLPSTCQR